MDKLIKTIECTGQTNYTAPLGGYYQVSSETVTFEPTDEFEEVHNPRYRWWKFWLPKTVSRRKYKKVVLNDVHKTVYLRSGETV